MIECDAKTCSRFGQSMALPRLICLACYLYPEPLAPACLGLSDAAAPVDTPQLVMHRCTKFSIGKPARDLDVFLSEVHEWCFNV